MNPHKIISILKDNLKDIYINKDELDKTIKGFGLDDKKDNIKYWSNFKRLLMKKLKIKKIYQNIFILYMKN